jgi:ribosomal protein S18 acetylase RimI-like enzyme
MADADLAARDLAIIHRMKIQVRPIRADEWERLRELRLAALRDAPYAFGEQYAQALEVPRTIWQERAEKGTRPESPVLVAQAGDEWLGMLRVGILDAPIEDEPLPEQIDSFPVGEMLSVFVRPEHRGRKADGGGGVASLLLTHGLQWARERYNAAWAVLDVTVANDKALAFYTRSGFEARACGWPAPSLATSRSECPGGSTPTTPTRQAPIWPN